ncbi:MAG TPA: ABC transporter substrate-binding protein, partial [Chloroflexota bacterium]|nr:ABC transporter substrate-binding protein [Chloroflexota bacterium]
MGRLTWQLAVAAAGMALVAAVLVSFARTAVFAEVPDYGGAYVEGLAGFPQAMNPVLANDDASRSVNALIFSGLTRPDANGQPVADLAESWEISPDGKTYTFVIRANARWHDGTPVSSEDVLFTIRTIQDPLYQGQLGSSWRDVAVEKPDDRTVKLTLQKDSYAPFIEHTSLGLLPAHL